MAFWDLGMAKMIIEAAPKYRRIVEPFADAGTLATFLAKKPPKEHIVNVVDPERFAILSFLQSLGPEDKKKLKSFDWVGSPETFASVVAITATEGAELFYKFFYLGKFAAKQKDPEAPPLFDWLKEGHDMSSFLFGLPVVKVGLKKATITNDDPFSVIGRAGGGDTFLVLLPGKPEDIEATEAKLGSISAPFFFAKKSKGNEELLDSIKTNGTKFNISTAAASSIMMAQLEIRTNYEGKLVPLEAPTAA